MKITKLYIIILLAIIFLQTNLFAETIDEKTFFNLGYDNYVNEKYQNGCLEVAFSGLEETVSSSTILQLKIDNYIPVTYGVAIKVYLNGVLESEIKDSNLSANNIIELYNTKLENNLLICVDNNYLPRLVLSKRSTIGNYLLAKINTDDFYQIVPGTAHTGELIPITIFIKNSGAEKVYIDVENAVKQYLENSQLENVSGDTEYKGLLLAGETKEIKYYIETNRNAGYVSPRAVLKYKTEFGQDIIRYTEPKAIKLEMPVLAIDSQIDVSRNLIVKQPIYGKIILRNITENAITNISLQPNFDGKITLATQEINLLKGKDFITIPFEIQTYTAKDKELNLKITYNTNEGSNSSSTQITLHSENINSNNAQITAVLIILTIVLYMWVVKI